CAKQIVADPNGDPTIRNLYMQIVLLGHGQARQMAEQIIASIRGRDISRRHGDISPSGSNNTTDIDAEPQQHPDDFGGSPEGRSERLEHAAALNNEKITDPTDAGAYPKPLKQQKRNTHSWENPDWSMLDDRRGQLPDFPLDTLTSAWRNWAERAAKGA